MQANLLEWLQWLSPIVSGVVCWIAGRFLRRSDSLQKMQQTIDLLVEKNKELYDQVTELRKDNAELKAGQQQMMQENATLRKRLEEIKG